MQVQSKRGRQSLSWGQKGEKVKKKKKKLCVGLRDQRGEKWDKALGWGPRRPREQGQCDASRPGALGGAEGSAVL